MSCLLKYFLSKIKRSCEEKKKLRLYIDDDRMTCCNLILHSHLPQDFHQTSERRIPRWIQWPFFFRESLIGRRLFSKLLIFNIKHFVTNSFLLVRGGKTLSCRVTRASFANVAAMFKTFLPSFLPFCYQTIVWQGLLVLPFLEKTLKAVKGPFFEYRVSFRDPRQFCSPVTSSRKFSPEGQLLLFDQSRIF